MSCYTPKNYSQNLPKTGLVAKSNYLQSSNQFENFIHSSLTIVKTKQKTSKNVCPVATSETVNK